MNYTPLVYQALKSQGPLSARKIANYLRVPVERIRPAIDNQIKAGYLKVRGDTIVIIRPMEGPGPIIDVPLTTPTLPPTLTIDRKDEYQSLEALSLPGFYQGDNPSCVGHAYASIMQINYWRLTGIPSPEKLSLVYRDNYDQDTGMRYDMFGFPTFSPWWIFQAAKKTGGMEGQYGARVSDGIDVLQEIGAVPWWVVLTPKSASNLKWYPSDFGSDEKTWEKLKTIADSHRVKSTAASCDPEQICDQIQQYGGAVGGVRVFSSILTSRDIVMPGKGDVEIGRHTLGFVGFNRLSKTFTYLNSWEGLWLTGKISWDYVQEYGGLCYSPIDTYEPVLPSPPADTKKSEPSNTSMVNRILQMIR